MNKKVEELVERVAEYLYDDMCGSGCHGGAGWGQTYKDDATDEDKQEYRGYAKTILSHPDLALIDRERELPGTLISVGNAYLISQMAMLDAGYLPVIPLAEALKESEK